MRLQRPLGDPPVLPLCCCSMCRFWEGPRRPPSLFHKLEGGVEEEVLFSILTASLISSRLRQQKPPPPAQGAKDGGGGGGESPGGGGKWKRKRILRMLLPEEQWLCQRKGVVLHRTHKTAVPVVVRRANPAPSLTANLAVVIHPAQAEERVRWGEATSFPSSLS